MLKKLATTFRFPNWWDSKIPPLLAFIYFRMIIADESFSFTLLLPVLLFLVWAISAAGFGHYVNDCFDIESDNIAGKPNQAANHSFTVRVLVSLSLTTSAIIPWFFLSNSGEIWIWVISHLVLFILYSAPPVRLKEKGVLGVLADSFYAHVIPIFLAFHALDGLNFSESIPNQPSFIQFADDFFPFIPISFIILCWAFFFGLRGILGHQVQDFGKDRASGTKTFVTKIGQKISAGIIHYFLAPLEIILFILIWGGDNEKTFFPLLGIFAIFIAWKIYLQVKLWKVSLRNDYGIPFLNSILNNFYEQWLPVILLGYLSWMDPKFLFVLFVHLLLFQSTWRNR